MNSILNLNQGRLTKSRTSNDIGTLATSQNASKILRGARWRVNRSRMLCRA
jgi:hypothetical protein